MKLSEDRIQSEYHKWLWMTYPKTRGLCYHIPNGGLRTPVEAARLQSMGVLSGVPDYHHAIPAHGFASLYIEFKDESRRGKAPTEHEKKQERRQMTLRQAGNQAHVCYTLPEAQNILLAYLSGTDYLTP